MGYKILPWNVISLAIIFLGPKSRFMFLPGAKLTEVAETFYLTTVTHFECPFPLKTDATHSNHFRFQMTQPKLHGHPRWVYTQGEG